MGGSAVDPVLFIGEFLALIGFMGIMACISENKEQKKLRKETKLVTEGDLDYVVYGKYDYIREHCTGAMVHTTHRETVEMPVTVIYFTDGRTVVLDGRCDMEFPKDTKIRVMENGLRKRYIEKA